MKDKNQFYVKNPAGIVHVVGESELEQIKQRDGFQILGPATNEASGHGNAVELPKDEERNPLECLTCGYAAPTAEELRSHLEEHVQSEGSSTSETSSRTTSPKSTSRRASKKSASKSSGSARKTAPKKK